VATEIFTDPFPSDDEIAERAYQMFLERASTALGSAGYWRLAEAELLEKAVRQVLRLRDRRDRPHSR
jgi:hypothetical protein